MILDQFGRVATAAPPPVRKVASPGFTDNMKVWHAYSSYLSSLYGLNYDAIVRAREPIANHVWVYACAMAIAQNIAQPEFKIMQETEDVLAARYTSAQKRGMVNWSPPRRENRQGIARHLRSDARRQGRKLKGMQPYLEHPVMSVFGKPNDLMPSMSEVWQVTWLWMSIRGSAFWVLQNKDDTPLMPGDYPEEIWPMSPDLFEPVFSENRLAAWWYRVPKGAGRTTDSRRILLQLHEVVNFKYPNPFDLIRGFTPSTAAASAVHQDMLAKDHNRSSLMNGAEPGGVLVAEIGSEFETPDKEQEFIEKWAQRHKGPKNARKPTILRGMEWIPTGMNNKDLEYIEMLRWDREEILAAYGMPKSILSVTDDLNYATQTAQDKNFWDKNLMPKIEYSERVIDGTLMYNESDNVMACFDLSTVQALKGGAAEMLAAAKSACGPELHMPPRVAFEAVGLDIEGYEGDDKSLITPMLTTVENVLMQSAPPPLIGDVPPLLPGGDVNPPATPLLPTPGGSPQQPGQQPNKVPPLLPAPGQPAAGQPNKVPPLLHLMDKTIVRAKRVETWKNITRLVQQPHESMMSSAWRGWVLNEAQIALEQFDRVAAGKKAFDAIVLWVEKEINDIEAIFPDVNDMAKRLRQKMRPQYQAEMQSTYDFTVKEIGGINVFEIDDPRIQRVIEKREDILVGNAPKTLQRNMRESISKGIQNGETLEQLRRRVARTYKVAASSPKALTVARTESAGFMNAARDEMFKIQGFKEQDWLTAEDEHVRPNHVTFGEAGPQEMGFNWLSLVDGSGTLEFAGDSRAPAGEVINCRCVMGAAR